MYLNSRVKIWQEYKNTMIPQNLVAIKGVDILHYMPLIKCAYSNL